MRKCSNTFDYNFKNIPLKFEKGIMRMVYFVLHDGALTLKMPKMALNPLCNETLQVYIHL